MHAIKGSFSDFLHFPECWQCPDSWCELVAFSCEVCEQTVKLACYWKLDIQSVQFFLFFCFFFQIWQPKSLLAVVYLLVLMCFRMEVIVEECALTAEESQTCPPFPQDKMFPQYLTRCSVFSNPKILCNWLPLFNTVYTDGMPSVNNKTGATNSYRWQRDSGAAVAAVNHQH